LHFWISIPTKVIDAMAIPESGPSCKAARAHRATLPETIEWRLWKNRQRRDAVVVSLSTHEGRNLIGVRLYTTSQEGKMLPTAKGVSLVVARLPELHAAITKAHAKAVELGLLDKSETAE
jgi:hypothetical protein